MPVTDFELAKNLSLSDAQWAELDRRLETIDEERKHAIGWEELKARMAVLQ